MGFVLAPFLVVGVVAAVIWFFWFRATVRYERAVERAKQQHADFEKRLCTPREPLYCLSCDKAFRGPLPEQDCPTCHIAAFVIPTATSENEQIRAAGASLTVPVMEEREQGMQRHISEQATENPPVQRNRNQSE